MTFLIYKNVFVISCFVLFVFFGVYLLRKLVYYLYKNKKHKEDCNCLECALDFVSVAFPLVSIIVMLILCYCEEAQYITGIECKDKLLLYKKSNIFGVVDNYGLKDEKYEDLHILQYKDPEFEILFQKHFNEYDTTSDMYVKVTIPSITVKFD